MTLDIDAGYITDDATGDGWRLMLGDSCERLAEIADHTVDLSVCSPPFAQLYNYSPSPRDLSNSRDRGEFFEHYSFIIREQLRVTRPGRLSIVHVQQIALQKALHGVIGLTDFRGEVIRAHEEAGWIFHGEVTIDKDPQAQAIRTKAHALMFVTKDRDAAGLRPALADYLLMFRAPGDNQTPVKTDVSNDEWIQWARPIWPGCGDVEAMQAMEDLGLILPRPAWYGIRETNTLNTRVAKEDADERHICPLQLDLIERCVRLWSSPGELVLSPFAGIGSEGYVSVMQGRRFVGCELKPSYWRTAVTNLRLAERQVSTPSLFDDEFDLASGDR
ncbi:site-specific DNA-methyltransferase [Microbispora sp. SCL1-1]|uniref:DNA-methyltransferase n=1 Tax=unclassified Microbispora TaxID=2614687 RepID=UPI00115928DD|nr:MULTISPECIES: DNA methyltransferase [unclassified Microbispora]NJP24422.1 site-specific DNA-methyltransferase [Microbispora sp. CL1-1]TQS14572.1 site-specific DNA-methyltransferase [Microbispora sp. SCL1-1]